jgi:regulatory protein
MAEIDDDDYIDTLKTILEKKRQELHAEKQDIIIKQKLARYAIGKGFESDLVWEMIGKIMIQK